MVVDIEKNCAELVSALEFKASNDALFFGRRKGFPVGVKCIPSSETLLLLFHVRHLRQSGAREFSNVHYKPEIEKLMAGDRLEVELGDRIAWVSFKHASEILASGSVPNSLDDILESFAKADLGGNNDLCHYCQRNHVEALSCHDGRVTQICEVCLAERLNLPANRPAEAAEGAVPVFALASAGALIGAAGWAFFWIGYEMLFEFLNTKKIVIPFFAELLALVLVALLTGGPVGFVIKRIGRRGRRLSVAAAILYTLAAVVVGEVLMIAWFIYREYKVFSPRIAWEVLPQFEGEMGEFHLIIKFVAAICAVVLAVELAKPRKPKLNL